jgi:uncharacterized protein (DUF2062 family)
MKNKGKKGEAGKKAELPQPHDPGPWERTKEFLKNHILHTDDSPERVARGVAVAFWVTFAIAPLLGLHIWVALLLAFVLQANKVSMLAFMWVHNPVTMWPIIYLNATVGGLVTRMWRSGTDTGIDAIREFLKQWQAEGIIVSMRQGDFWNRLWHMMLSVGAEVWIGGAVLGAVAAAATYFTTKYAVIWYRRTKTYREAKKQNKKSPA